jgi:formyl-CoA transferase
MGRYPRESAFNPLWNHYRCGDDKWICLAMLQADRYWKDFCAVMGLKDLADDPKFVDIRSRGRNARELVEIFDRKFASKPREEWMKILKDGGDFIYTLVNTISELPGDPQVIANDYIVEHEIPEIGKTKVVGLPIILSETPGEARGHAPELGQHTEEILTEMLGYSWDDIARLRESGAI